MKFGLIDNSLALCKKHLESARLYHNQIETLQIDSLLAASLVFMMYAEFEAFIKRTIDDKIDSMKTTSHRRKFIRARTKAYRGILSGDLGKFLNQIEPYYQDLFRSKINENPKAQSYYNNIITHRRSIAHKSGDALVRNFTFQEIDSFYQEGHIILDFFQDTLLES